MNVVGCHKVNPKLPAHAHKLLIDQSLFIYSVILQFQKEIAFSENFLIVKRGFARFVIKPAGKILLYLACQTRAQADNALRVALQNLVIHTGFIIKAVHESL